VTTTQLIQSAGLLGGALIGIFAVDIYQRIRNRRK
jgi:hypothetical protein